LVDEAEFWPRQPLLPHCGGSSMQQQGVGGLVSHPWELKALPTPQISSNDQQSSVILDNDDHDLILCNRIL